MTQDADAMITGPEEIDYCGVLFPTDGDAFYCNLQKGHAGQHERWNGPTPLERRLAAYPLTTAEHRYAFRCSCGYRAGRLITLAEANSVLVIHSKHGGTQEVHVHPVGEVVSVIDW